MSLLPCLCTPKMRIISIDRFIALNHDAQLNKSSIGGVSRTIRFLHIRHKIIPGSKLSKIVFMVLNLKANSTFRISCCSVNSLSRFNDTSFRLFAIAILHFKLFEPCVNLIADSTVEFFRYGNINLLLALPNLRQRCLHYTIALDKCCDGSAKGGLRKFTPNLKFTMESTTFNNEYLYNYPIYHLAVLDTSSTDNVSLVFSIPASGTYYCLDTMWH